MGDELEVSQEMERKCEERSESGYEWEKGDQSCCY